MLTLSSKRVRSALAVMTTSFVFASALSATSIVLADETAAVQSSIPAQPDWRSESDQFSGRTAALRMFGGLFVCLGVFFVGVRMYRRFSGVTATTSKKRIKIIERVALTQKGSIALISIDDKEFLVGMGSEAPRMLGRVSKSDTESFIEELSREDEIRVAV